MNSNNPGARQNQIFTHKIRTLSMDELDKVVGAGPYEELSGMKNVSAQDNQVRTMS
jgi:hypothetical protein